MASALPSSCLWRRFSESWWDQRGERIDRIPRETLQDWHDSGILQVDKPFDAKELLQRAQRVLDRSGRTTKAARGQAND